MADVEVTYRGQIIRSMSASGTEVLHTGGKLCDDDITIDYTSPGGGGANLQTKSVSYTPSESAISDTILPDPGYDGMDEVDVSVAAIPDTYVGSGITRRSSADLSVMGRTVTAPSGYYSLMAAAQVAAGTAGTPTASKGAVSNHSVDVTPSVTNTTGYITGSTITGTPVTVSAAELVSGSQTVTVNDTYDVTNLAEMVVNVSGGGGGSALLASGTFVGTGPGAMLLNIGTKLPLRDFAIYICADGEDAFPYNADYKNIFFGAIVSADKNEMYLQAQGGSYDNYRCHSIRSLQVDNSGVITNVTSAAVPMEVGTIRNTSFGCAGPTSGDNDNFSFQLYSDHVNWRWMYPGQSTQYFFHSAITYKWFIYYFGSDPANDIIEV